MRTKAMLTPRATARQRNVTYFAGPSRDCYTSTTMCNQYSTRGDGKDLARMLDDLALPLVAGSIAAHELVRPTDLAPVLRATAGGVEAVDLRWGFAPGRPKAGPVINYRSDGRRFDHGRCLVPATAFFEFTGARSPKTRWRFSRTDAPWLCIAGLWRRGVDGSERFTMLTTEPGPDLAPYHDRQIVILEPTAWARWLAPEPIAPDWLGPLPAGALTVTQP